MTLLRALLAVDARGVRRFVVMPLLGGLASASLAAQEPVRPLPPASPPPPVGALPTAPVAPPANAVALCNDQTFVVAPAVPSDCATRGGLKLVLPTYRASPPVSAAAATAAASSNDPAPTLRNEAPPAGATMRCKDGLWLSGVASATRCERNGGLAVILPAAPSLPPRVP